MAVGELAIAADISVDPRTGAVSLSVPVMTPVGRDGFAPQLALSYSSGGGNSAFGSGWGLSGLPSISVRTSDHLPRWDGTDGFELAGEELVPWLREDEPGAWTAREHQDGDWNVRFFRTVSSSQVRIEFWQHRQSRRIHFRSRDASNVLTVFGARLDGSGRIADPEDSSRTFSWLPEIRIDPFGNALRIEYREETTDGIDFTAPSERRNPSLAQRYIKRIRYGNSSPLTLSETFVEGTSRAPHRWHFQVVFDYGDHSGGVPSAEADRDWPVRQDVASSSRAGFDVRTYRLCRRILAFHDFDELGEGPTLIGQTILGHAESPVASQLETIGYTGHRRDPRVGQDAAFSSRSLPPLKLEYAPAATEESFIAPPAVTRAHLPAGFASNARVVDLFGEGLFGILKESQGGWLYRQNLGDGEFAGEALVLEKPVANPASFQFGDIDRDGDLEFSRLSGRGAGAYEYDREAASWQGFRPFEQFPHLEAYGDRAQWLDLNGDGRADIVVSKADSLVWFASSATDEANNSEGFEEPVEIPLPADSLAVPSARTDAAADFFFADMNGDGLADLVRVDSSRVEYWPSLGNGRFSDGVVMDTPPFLATAADFDIARLRFVDLDGSGTTDLVYIGVGEVSCWINAAGARFVSGPQLGGLPIIDNVSSARILDFLGDGRACLVWSSPLPGADGLRYLPLTPKLWPGLLLSVDNSRGLQTRLHYASSAEHYLRAQRDGQPWRAPMPGHHLVVDEYETIDQIAGTRSVLRYQYHDGTFDRQKREPRGFARTDVTDVQTAVHPDAPSDRGRLKDDAISVEPSLTRIWFHLGTEMRGRHRIRGYYIDDSVAKLAPHTVSSDSNETSEDGGELATDEWFDALELLAGEVIRTEVYSLDAAGSPGAVPFEVQQSSRLIRRTQPKHAGHPAAFSIDDGQSLSAVLERTAGDPRVTHRVVIQSDGYGVVTSAAEIAYPRHSSKPRETPAQDQTLVSVVETRSVHIDVVDRFELGVPIETKRFELAGLAGVEESKLIGRSDLRSAAVKAALADPQPHHQPLGSEPEPASRLLSWDQSFYWNSDRTGALPHGIVGEAVLVHHERGACFASGQIDEVFEREEGEEGEEGDQDPKASDARLEELGYQRDGELWWQPDPVHLFSSPEMFSRRVGTERADGARATVEYDTHQLAIVSSTDTLGIRTSTEIDYHRLAPRRAIDGNGTVLEARADPLGVVVTSTSRGDVEGQPWGFEALDGTALQVPSSADEVIANANELLGGASSYAWSDLDAWSQQGTPTTVVSLARETLVHDGAGGIDRDGRIQIAVAYLDGHGRELQSRRLVEAGPAIARDDSGAVIVDGGGRPILEDADERWLVSGHIVYDAKEQAVEQYEPYHSRTFAFEDDAVLRAVGVSALSRYDAIGRVVATHYPNGTFSQTIFGAWSTEQRDANDTVLTSAYLAARESLPADHPQKQALEHAKAHADTSSRTIVDPMGRVVATLALGSRGSDGTGDQGDDIRTESVLDIDGHALATIDGRGIEAFRYLRDMAGRILFEESVDGGPSRGLADAFDRSVYAWNARGFEVERGYDLADRPLFTHVRGGDTAEAALDHRVEEWVYGESLADSGDLDKARARNAVGQIIAQRDGAGVLEYESYDPSGNVLAMARRLRVATRSEPDWHQTVELESEPLRERSSYDAAGRAIRTTSTDGTTQQFAYSRSGPLTKLLVTTADGRLDAVPILEQARFNPRGQSIATRLGNGIALEYAYEPDTQRLSHQRASRGERLLQSIKHTYDPAGNLVRLTDEAQEGPGGVISGTTVGARRDYKYDAHYRLLSATGRVHQALLQHDWMPGAGGTVKGTRHISLNNGAAIERFTRTFKYDRAGNLLAVKHLGNSQSFTNAMWVSTTSNRSVAALDPNGSPVAQPETHFDSTGNLTKLAHLRRMEWNWRGALSLATVIERSGPDAGSGSDDDEHYVYGGDGLRVRKLSTAVRGSDQLEQTETLTIGASTRKRIVRNGTVILERWTTKLGGHDCLAILHRWTKDDLGREVDDIAQPRIHYQLKTHQGSSAIELDRDGRIISYEEYFPYGGSAFIAGDNLREVKRKDIRYSGKQRDDVTGFYDYGYRLYAPWLCRWLSPDPIGPEDHLNLYQFVLGDPVSNVDAMGLDTIKPGEVVIKHASRRPANTLYGKLASLRASLTPRQRTGFFTLSNAERHFLATDNRYTLVPKDPRADVTPSTQWAVISKTEFRESWEPANAQWAAENGKHRILTVNSDSPTTVPEGGAAETETSAATASGTGKTEGKEDPDADGDAADGVVSDSDSDKGDGRGAGGGGGKSRSKKKNKSGDGQKTGSERGESAEGKGPGGNGTGKGKGDGAGPAGAEAAFGATRGGRLGGISGGTVGSRGITPNGKGTSSQPNAPDQGGTGALGGVSSGGTSGGAGRKRTGAGGGGIGSSVSNRSAPRTSATAGSASTERGEGPEGVGYTRGTDKPYSWHDVSIDMLGIANAAGRSESGSRSGGVPGGWGWLGRKGTFWQTAHILTTVLTGGIVGAILSLPALIKSLPKLTWALIKSLPSLLRLGLRGLAKLLRVGVRNIRSLAVTGAQHLDAARQRFLGALWRLPTQLLSRMRGPGRANPSEIRFSQPTASPNFSDGGTINDTISALQNGLSPDSIPTIRIFERNGIWFTVDNRRLAAFIAAGVDDIPVIRITKPNADLAKKIKNRTNPIGEIGEMIVIVAKKGRPRAIATLREHGKIP